MMRKLAKILQSLGFSICSVYLLDVNFLSDDSKYLSGLLMALSASMTLELPSFTVLSKCDLVEDKAALKKYTKLHKLELREENFDKNSAKLTKEIAGLLFNSGMGKLLTLDINEEESV